MEDRFWKERRVFVTGATGFVGSWLVRALLTRGAVVTALVRDLDPQSQLYYSGDFQQLTFVNGELENFLTLERALNEYEIETVFHLGAQTLVGPAYRSPLPTFESNIRGTYNLLEACRRHSPQIQQIVVASSDKAYGELSGALYTEESPLQGQHPYDVSKSCADLITQSYYHTYGLPVAITRCGNVYGGGDLNWSRIVPGTLRSLLRGEAPLIRSDGTYIRDYIYVEDVAQAYLQLAERMGSPAILGESFNFSTENPVTVLDLVQTIARLMGCESLKPKIQNIAHAEIRAQRLSAAKARRMLDWHPDHTLEQGLEKTIAWYREYSDIHTPSKN